MRLPTFTESLFGASLFFLCCYLAAFNYELLGRDEVCSIDLLTTNEGACLVNPGVTSEFRLIVNFGGDIDTVTTKVPVSIHITSETYEYSKTSIIQKSAITGAGRRYYQTLNYGDFKISKNEETEILLKAGAGVENLRLFKAQIVPNLSNIYIYTFAMLFLLFLFLSIFLRKKIFLQRYGKPIPYILYFFVALIALTWNI